MRSLRFFLQIAVLLMARAAAADSGYEIVSFYEASGYLTERFIPFAVHGPGGQNVAEIVSVKVARPCYAMIDPYRAYIFHIYCTEATTASFDVLVRDGGEAVNITLPEITITKKALVSSTPSGKKGGGSSGGGGDPVAAGRKLFTDNQCNTCHSSPYPLPSNVTASMISNAIASVPEMARFSGLSAQQKAQLARYISEGL